MAYYDKQSGQIVLSQDDKEIFGELQNNQSKKAHPISDSIMKNILKGVDSTKLDKNRATGQTEGI